MDSLIADCRHAHALRALGSLAHGDHTAGFNRRSQAHAAGAVQAIVVALRANPSELIEASRRMPGMSFLYVIAKCGALRDLALAVGGRAEWFDGLYN